MGGKLRKNERFILEMLKNLLSIFHYVVGGGGGVYLAPESMGKRFNLSGVMI